MKGTEAVEDDLGEKRQETGRTWTRTLFRNFSQTGGGHYVFYHSAPSQGQPDGL
jgi:hypothetical protein